MLRGGGGEKNKQRSAAEPRASSQIVLKVGDVPQHRGAPGGDGCRGLGCRTAAPHAASPLSASSFNC